MELSITRSAKTQDVQTFSRLPSVPGLGQILALVIPYESQDIARFPRVQDFVSYCRLVKCAKESNGKRLGTSGKKIGNVPLRWAVAEAAVLFLRHNQPGKEYFTKLAHKHGKAKALTVLAHKRGRAVYYLLTREQAFDLNRFVTASPLRGETEPMVSLADNGESLLDVPALEIQHGLCGNIWTHDPEPYRLIGPSLPLTCLVIRHQVPRGCPSPESDPHEACLRTQPAALRRPA